MKFSLSNSLTVVIAALALLAGCLEGPAGPAGVDGKDGSDGENGKPYRIFVQEGKLYDSLGTPDSTYGIGWKRWQVDLPDSIGAHINEGALVQVYGQILGLGWRPLQFRLGSPFVDRRVIIFHDQCLSYPCSITWTPWDYRVVVGY